MSLFSRFSLRTLLTSAFLVLALTPLAVVGLSTWKGANEAALEKQKAENARKVAELESDLKVLSSKKAAAATQAEVNALETGGFYMYSGCL